jgi:hypothetical protein
MHILEVRATGDDDFAALLKEMRLWLDEHRVEASTSPISISIRE